jgi:hypothetical protein
MWSGNRSRRPVNETGDRFFSGPSVPPRETFDAHATQIADEFCYWRQPLVSAAPHPLDPCLTKAVPHPSRVNLGKSENRDELRASIN